MKNDLQNTALYVGQEIKDYFARNGISQQEAADTLGVTQAAVSARLCGLKPFGKNAAMRWSQAFGFRRAWLLTGDGPMMGTETEITAKQSIRENSGVAILQTGDGSSVTTGDGNYFATLCKQLMEQILERDRRICCLEEEIKKLKDGDL